MNSWNAWKGASVTLRQRGQVSAQLVMDVFGEFRFDGLAAHSGQHEIAIAHPVHGEATIRASVGTESLNLGEIRLTVRDG